MLFTPGQTRVKPRTKRTALLSQKRTVCLLPKTHHLQSFSPFHHQWRSPAKILSTNQPLSIKISSHNFFEIAHKSAIMRTLSCRHCHYSHYVTVTTTHKAAATSATEIMLQSLAGLDFVFFIHSLAFLFVSILLNWVAGFAFFDYLVTDFFLIFIVFVY